MVTAENAMVTAENRENRKDLLRALVHYDPRRSSMTWFLTREEKEQKVIELYKQNKTIRDIAEILHMSFRDIGVTINKFKADVEQEKGYTDEAIDTEPKSKESQSFKLFSEGKSPVQVVVALDLPADEVRAIYRNYWELKGMYKLVGVYEETKGYLLSFLNLYGIVKSQGMAKDEIINMLKLANNNELQYLLEKVDYLRNQINMLELEKTKSTNDLLILNRRIDKLTESENFCKLSLDEKREEIACLNQELRRLDNFVTNNNDNQNDEDIEIFYTGGSWQYPKDIEQADND